MSSDPGERRASLAAVAGNNAAPSTAGPPVGDPPAEKGRAPELADAASWQAHREILVSPTPGIWLQLKEWYHDGHLQAGTGRDN